MDSRRLFFDPSSGHGNMLFLGNGDSLFRGPRSIMNIEEASKKRPFFTSPEDIFDEEYYDEQMPEKKRRLTPEQVHMLEKSFEAENKLEPERKTQLAKKLGLQPRQVAVWFQNRRARWKTKQLERDYDLLKSSYDSLLSEYDSILKEKEKLQSEVVSLTEKLQTKEVAGTPTSAVQKVEQHQADAADDAPPAPCSVKVEDRLSSGSGASAVVDEDGPQLLDSGDSYFQNAEYPGCLGVQSEEDDGSDDGQSYFSDALVLPEPHEEGGVGLTWWGWP